MQQKSRTVCLILFAALLFFPALKLILGIAGMTFTLRFGIVPALLLLGLCIAALCLSICGDKERENRVFGFIFPMPLLCVINFFILSLSDDIDAIESGGWRFAYMLLLGGAMLVCAILCVLLRLRYFESRRARTASIIVAAVLLSIAAKLMLAAGFGASLGTVTVVKTVDSPDGMHYAQIIDADGGATGGDTWVRVYKSGELDLGIIRFNSKFDTVYTGEWGEFNGMRLEWKDNETLLINGKEYPIG